MQVTVKSLAQYCAVLIFLSSLSLASCKVENKNDQELRRYLERVMRNYTTYIKLKKYDPTPPPPFATFMHSGGSFRTTLHCKLGNHTVSGLSKSEHNVISTFSNFTDHMFAVRFATFGSSISFQGNFSCTGKVKRLWGSELEIDIPFSGNGTFLVKANVLVETYKVRNVGITEDHRFNLLYNRPEYELRMNATSVQLRGIWSDPVVTHNYLEDIQKTFLQVYLWNRHHPTEHLLGGYLSRMTNRLRLADILTDLPAPYTQPKKPWGMILKRKCIISDDLH